MMVVMAVMVADLHLFFKRKRRSCGMSNDFMHQVFLPGLRIETSTPRTKTCSRGPRTWGTRLLATIFWLFVKS